MFIHFTTLFSFEILEPNHPKLILIGLIPSYKLDEIEQVLLLKSRTIQVESSKNVTILVFTRSKRIRFV